MTKEDRFFRDISAIKTALKSIAEDLRYFRQKDESAAVVEEKKYTCKDCKYYTQHLVAEPNELIHWCTLNMCTISEEGLEKTCHRFLMEDEF